MKKIFILILYSILFFVSFLFLTLLPWNEEKNQPLTDLKPTVAIPPKPQIEKEGQYLKDFSFIREKFILEKKDFLEANLGEMKFNIYEAGSLTKELPIFARGKPDDWGGTPLGSYQISSKYRIAYSLAADSYMPWSLQIYGKYFIHGENYDVRGNVDSSLITGGCVRLKNQNAKIVYDATEIDMPILVTDRGFENDDYRYPNAKNKDLLKISAKNYLVADLDSGFVFSDSNRQEKIPLGSIAKLMTAVIIFENVDLRKPILITPYVLEPPGDTKDLKTGKVFRVFEFFWPLLVESSSDAAKALSISMGEGKTVRLMNEKAKATLMEGTNFVDPLGLSEENITTSEDLFYLARYLLNSRPTLLKISRGEKIQTFGYPLSFTNLDNKNIFFDDPNFVGGKTNYMDAPRASGLFVFKLLQKDGTERKVAIILFGSESSEGPQAGLKKDTEQVLNWLKENYFKETQ